MDQEEPAGRPVAQLTTRRDRQRAPHDREVDDERDDSVEPAPRRAQKGIYILPNLFTLGALFGGFYAIVMAMNGRFEQAAIGIFARWCSTASTAASRA